ncbi:MAG: Fe(3+)-pyochelin receptor [Acinetobacter bereziniae]|uniref:Fe(3+)-pyochelin receptor n=1 Tax=Acinetobacter bereziniae TaxID=106648 RepID=A0A833UQ62_ACIBZ|nr:MAG: Fe(3+)-pyochelin receptor [Acinetobacter bereziniae]
MRGNHKRKTLLSPISKLHIMIALMGGALSSPYVFSAEASEISKSYNFNIPAGALGEALLAVGYQSKIQIIAESHLVQGLKNTAVSGQYTVSTVLDRLFQGSGLGYRIYDQNIILYKLPPNADNEITLGVVRIQGSAEVSEQGSISGTSVGGSSESERYGGINGSRDVTATEGSKSYATNQVNIGGKTPTRLNEVTNAISVLTNQRIEDQGIQSIDNALQRSTGVTRLIDQNGNLSYYSRGFSIGNVQIDGGAANSDNDLQLNQTDLSMYDSIQILRGADAFGNAGSSSSPSATINLVRKKPLDHKQLNVELSAGSWDSYRGSVDVTGPIALDGSVRGRLIATGENRNEFYDNSNKKNELIFGTLEADITPNTLFTIGASYQNQDIPFWRNGLPRYMNGDDLKLPRSTSLIMPYNRPNNETYELFTKLNQKINKDWSWNSSLSYKESSYDGQTNTLTLNYIQPDGSVLEEAYLGSLRYKDDKNKLLSWDTAINGQFDLFGLPQKVEFGFNSSQQNYNSLTEQVTDIFQSVNIFNLNRDQLVGSAFDSSNKSYYLVSNKRDTTYLTGYGSFDFNIFPKLHFLTGVRWSYTDFNLLNHASAPAMNLDRDTAHSKYKDTHWQVPAYALRYDFNQQWSSYIGYKDIYQSQAGYITANGQPLAPQTGNSREVGIKYTSAKDDLNISLALYKSKVDNISLQDWIATSLHPGDSSCCYVVGGGERYESKGADLEIQGKILPWWEQSLGYTYNLNKRAGSTLNYDGEIEAVDQVPVQSQSPKHLLKLWNTFHFSGNKYLNHLKAGIGLTAQSKTSVVGFIRRGDDFYDYNFKGPGYTVMDALVSYDINKNINLSFNVNNIFDKTYYVSQDRVTSGNWYGAPRNYLLTLRAKF